MNEETIWTVVGVAIVTSLLAYGVNKLFECKFKKKHDDSHFSTQITHELMTRILRGMNCEMYPNKDNEGWYDFEFQGGAFAVYFDGPWVRLEYPVCYMFSLSDVDKFSSTRRLINELN